MTKHISLLAESREYFNLLLHSARIILGIFIILELKKTLVYIDRQNEAIFYITRQNDETFELLNQWTNRINDVTTYDKNFLISKLLEKASLHHKQIKSLLLVFLELTKINDVTGREIFYNFMLSLLQKQEMMYYYLSKWYEVNQDKYRAIY